MRRRRGVLRGHAVGARWRPPRQTFQYVLTTHDAPETSIPSGTPACWPPKNVATPIATPGDAPRIW